MLNQHVPGWHIQLDEVFVRDSELNTLAEYIGKELKSNPDTQIYIRPYLVETMLEKNILARENFIVSGHYNSWGDNSMADGSVESTYYFSETDDIIYLAKNSSDFYQITYFKKNGDKDFEYHHYTQGMSHVICIYEEAKL